MVVWRGRPPRAALSHRLVSPFACSQAGVSRSVAVVTAYLMKTQGLGWEEAYAAVRAAKPDAE